MPFFLLLIAISVLICKWCRLSPETPSSFSVNNTAAPAQRALPAAYLQGYRSPAGAAAAASPPDRLLRRRPRRGAFGKAPAAALAAGTAAPATQPPPGTPSSGAGPAAQRDPPKPTAPRSSPVGTPASQAAPQPRPGERGRRCWKVLRAPDEARNTLCGGCERPPCPRGHPARGEEDSHPAWT